MLRYQWWLPKIGADKAPDPPGPGKPVTVIDAGIDPLVPDLIEKKNMTALNWRGVGSRDLAASQTVRHGMKVASVIVSARSRCWPRARMAARKLS